MSARSKIKIISFISLFSVLLFLPVFEAESYCACDLMCDGCKECTAWLIWPISGKTGSWGERKRADGHWYCHPAGHETVPICDDG